MAAGAVRRALCAVGWAAKVLVKAERFTEAHALLPPLLEQVMEDSVVRV